MVYSFLFGRGYIVPVNVPDAHPAVAAPPSSAAAAAIVVAVVVVAGAGEEALLPVPELIDKEKCQRAPQL